MHSSEIPGVVNFKVKSTASVVELSDALFHRILERGVEAVTLTAGGPHAVNQACKALTATRDRLRRKNKNIAWYCIYVHLTGDEDGKRISFLQFHLLEYTEEEIV
jgi:stage V sporulation protein SpoVS